MPIERKPHAAVVQGRVQRAHTWSILPSSVAAPAKANATGEADVARVEHRRVNGERRILQQRVQVTAIRCGREQALERIRRCQCEQQEREADDAELAQHARAEAFRQARDAEGHRDGPAAPG